MILQEVALDVLQNFKITKMRNHFEVIAKNASRVDHLFMICVQLVNGNHGTAIFPILQRSKTIDNLVSINYHSRVLIKKYNPNNAKFLASTSEQSFCSAQGSSFL